MDENFKPRKEKATESMKIHVGETLKRDLSILAAYAGQELSAYVRQVLELHAHGALHQYMASLSEHREIGRRPKGR